MKLQFPKFDGSDPQGSTYKAEQYFIYKDVPSEDRAHLASFHLEEIALQWHRWLSKFQGPLTWDEFTKAVMKLFGPTDYENPSEALTRLKQMTTVADYQETFEQLSHRVDKVPEEFLIGAFMAGLKDEVRIDVKLKQPQSLSDAIEAARLIEEKNNLQKKISNQGKSGWSGKNNSNPSILSHTPNNSNTGSKNSTPLSRRISGQEAKERREKGLCYYCDEKYLPGHRCIKPQLFAIEEINYNEYEGEKEEEFVLEISLHAISGTTHSRTLR